ncbi:MAG: transposase [Burkholderia sp.]
MIGGIEEISIRKGHTYRIVVSDRLRGRPIWFGGENRSAASIQQFYDWLGEKKVSDIRLIMMDMWKPFRNVAPERAPQAAILFDKFHVMKSQGCAGSGTQEQICPPGRQGPALHQRPQVCVVCVAEAP